MKKEEAAQKTTSALLIIARKHFTQYGYAQVSLEKIAEEGHVTRGAVYHHFKSKQGLFLAVLDLVQKDVAIQTEQEAVKSSDPWQQLILGCLGFIKGANTEDCRRILLVDAPAVIGWDAWRKSDLEHAANVLQKHINELKDQDYLEASVDTELMSRSISGALNELALNYSANEAEESTQAIHTTIVRLVAGFRKMA